VARARVLGAAVTVAVTHLGTDQRESARQLRALLRALCARPRPWLVLGDLNRHRDQVIDRFEAAGLVVAGGPPTYPMPTPWARIDHVAVAGLRLTRVEAVPMPVSDHCALVAEVDVEPGGADLDLR
jgi:endonuclease/exonuclease/phosphatase family metal-dependent hydrolase